MCARLYYLVTTLINYLIYYQLGVGDMTQILYHDNDIYHDIVIFSFYKGFYDISIFDTIEFS